MKIKVYVDSLNDSILQEIQTAVEDLTGKSPNIRVIQEHMGANTPNVRQQPTL